MPTQTPDLRAERKRINAERAALGLKDITVGAIAARLGVSRQAVHALEAHRSPDPEKVTDYLAARDALCDGTVTA